MAARGNFGQQLADQTGGFVGEGHRSQTTRGGGQTAPNQYQGFVFPTELALLRIVNEHQVKVIEQLDIIKKSLSHIMKVNLKRLRKHELKIPLDVLIEPDGEGFLARTIDLELYGYGDDAIEATENLIYEIESLYEDLLVDDNFSPEWLNVKKFLKQIIK